MNDNLTPDSEPWSPGGREVLQLFPPPTRARRLEGLYLNERMPPPARGAPALVYANFVSSLDGRIAVTDDDGLSRLPEGLTNPRDWRLFRELQAHADCLVTHGGYLRALATGRLGNVLQVGLGADGGDIARWRAAREMTAQPAVAIVSASLELPMPTSLAAHGQRVHVLTTEASRRDRRAAMRQAGFDVVVTGPGPWVRSREAIDALAERGYRRLYLQTGPKMLEVALREGTLARLYLTIRHRIAGGERFDTMVGGGVLGESGKVRLGALYLDEACGQFFACFDATGGSGTEGW
ncbi:MAG: dihydrofolate reductase family protein [Thiotrichales bacterium]|nr:dihydrofolate reductase family protein [Thiotrichales bacterium]